MKTTDTITKDIDLRAHLPPPISLTNSLISSTIIDQDLVASTVTTSVPIASNAIADRKYINLTKRKNIAHKNSTFSLLAA